MVRLTTGGNSRTRRQFPLKDRDSLIVCIGCGGKTTIAYSTHKMQYPIEDSSSRNQSGNIFDDFCTVWHF